MLAHADRTDVFGLYTKHIGSVFNTHRIARKILLLTHRPKTQTLFTPCLVTNTET